MFSEQELQMWHKITITWFMYWAHREYSVETYVNIRKGITHECIFWTDDSIYRNNTGVCLRTVYEKRTEPTGAESVSGLCIRGDGGGFRMVPSDPGHGHERGNGKVCFYSGSSRLASGSGIFAYYG